MDEMKDRKRRVEGQRRLEGERRKTRERGMDRWAYLLRGGHRPYNVIPESEKRLSDPPLNLRRGSFYPFEVNGGYWEGLSVVGARLFRRLSVNASARTLAETEDRGGGEGGGGLLREEKLGAPSP